MKKAILVVSFGTSYEEARRRNIESIENHIHETFTEYEVRRAFTSHFIIKKLLQRDGLQVDTVQEALDRLAKDGFEDIYIQPLHIIPGYEYEKVKRAVVHYPKGVFKVLRLGKPLLHDMLDYPQVVEALREQSNELDQADVVVLMGHGTDHFANGLYMTLQYFIDRSGLNVILGNVEGYPELKDLLPHMKTMAYKRVGVMPFMLVAGEHVKNDMVGNSEDSWVNVLESEGYEVEAMIRGLGENPVIHQIFIEKVQDLIHPKEA